MNNKKHGYLNCIECGCFNDYTEISCIDNIVAEAETLCKSCGHEDYWSYGYYERKSTQSNVDESLLKIENKLSDLLEFIQTDIEDIISTGKSRSMVGKNVDDHIKFRNYLSKIAEKVDMIRWSAHNMQKENAQQIVDAINFRKNEL